MPLTFFNSSIDLNGRAAIIFWAVFGPIPGSKVNCFSVALLMSMGLSG